MKRVLVLPIYGIGDALMTIPAVRNLKEHLDVEITYLHMFRTTHDILKNNPYIDSHVHFPFLESSKLAGIKFLLPFRKKFDCSINFYPSNRRDYNLTSFLIGCRARLGHRYFEMDLAELNFLKNRTLKEDDGLHNVEENLRLLSFLGIENPELYPMEIFLVADEVRFADYWKKEHGLEDKTIIGMHPGTSIFKNHAMKRWPLESFAGLIDRLAENLPGSAFLLFGGSEEQEIRETIISLVNPDSKVLSASPMTIRHAAALMACCKLFVSNDSGPMHMAVASGIPTVAIFGPTSPVGLRPWRVRHKVVRKDLSCSPCFRYSPKPMECVNKRHNSCIHDISVEQVLSASLELFAGASF
jgi:ADP-heptose:LPS heptosyltransferase